MSVSLCPSVCGGSASWSRCLPARGEGSPRAMLATARPYCFVEVNSRNLGGGHVCWGSYDGFTAAVVCVRVDVEGGVRAGRAGRRRRRLRDRRRVLQVWRRRAVRARHLAQLCLHRRHRSLRRRLPTSPRSAVVSHRPRRRPAVDRRSVVGIEYTYSTWISMVIGKLTHPYIGA